ncbi:proteasome regulatory particle lid subunit [Pichia kluyveri]|uniref:Proteasome regulatory particle lid subunit n=1 Tax=Pichia kluyveri TaxID=36015 RepID=A0AAV5RAH0_PICKL|nr:proteasome regulatory particle lid subunit [Pichia kluyveri]
MTIPSIQDADKAFTAKDYQTAESIYLDILNIDINNYNNENRSKSEKIIELQEKSIINLSKIYNINEDESKLIELINKSKIIMSGSFAKSKTSKIIKILLDVLENSFNWKNNSLTNSLNNSIKITNECIQWSIDQKRTFLQQSLKIRLSLLYYKNKNYMESLKIINPLIKEFKKLDDKTSLVDVQLLECKNYFQLKNFIKSRASLTSARTSANSIYCPSSIQAELDLMSGILNAQDKDFKTAYSYFYEAFENYQLHETKNDLNNEIEDNKSIKVLKYMILCKIMIERIDEINPLLKQKSCQKFINKSDIEAMKSVSNSYKNRSLKDLENSLKIYSKELTLDPIIRSHLSDLYDSLFQKNLLKLIEPYSCIEINHICSMIGLPKDVIESKLSNMILDKIIFGVLDQGNGCLIIYDEPIKDESYDYSLEIIKQMSNAVDLLYEKASTLS